MEVYRGTLFIYRVDIDFAARKITFKPEKALHDVVKPPTHIEGHYWQHFKDKAPISDMESLALALSEQWTTDLFGV